MFSRYGSSILVDGKRVIKIKEFGLSFVPHFDLINTRFGQALIDEDLLDSLGVLGDTRHSCKEPAVTDHALSNCLRLDTMATKEGTRLRQLLRPLECSDLAF